MRPGLGILIGLPVAGLITLLAIGAIAFGVHRFRGEDDYGYDFPGVFWMVGGVVVLLVTVGFTAVGFWPYQKQYHYWQPVSGTVVAVNSRLLPAGDKSIEQKFVVQLEGHSELYGIQDTRAALLKPGSHVDLSCIRVWQFGSGDHGYDCRWGAYR